MKFDAMHIDFVENESGKPVNPYPLIRLLPGSKIIRSSIKGPLYLSRYAQLGPDVTVGKYTGMNEHTYIARAEKRCVLCHRRAYCYQPFQSPDWLAQYS